MNIILFKKYENENGRIEFLFLGFESKIHQAGELVLKAIF